jgi:SAM-dependent methyltransferase
VNIERSHERKDIEYHAAIAAEYDRVVVEPRRHSIDALFRPLHKLLPPHKGAMLDLGCGTGHMLCRYAAGFDRVVAVDHSLEMLAGAQSNARNAGLAHVEFDRGDAFEFLRSRRGEKFDLITCVGFLHHLEQRRIAEIFALIESLLAADGLFVFAEPVETADREPWPITWWNASFRSRPHEYSHAAEDPDEAPLQISRLRQDAASAGLRIVGEGRGWEIFPRHEPPSRLDALAIPLLHRLFGAAGPVYWAACTRAANQEAPNNSAA